MGEDGGEKWRDGKGLRRGESSGERDAECRGKEHMTIFSKRADVYLTMKTEETKQITDLCRPTT